MRHYNVQNDLTLGPSAGGIYENKQQVGARRGCGWPIVAAGIAVQSAPECCPEHAGSVYAIACCLASTMQHRRCTCDAF